MGKNREFPPKHLLIIRLSAMGDVAMVVHVVRALRESYPDLRISMLTRELFSPLFRGLNVEFIPLDLAGRHKGVGGIHTLASDIAAQGVDCVADLHSVMRTALLRSILSLSGIPSMRLKKGRVSKWMRMDGGCSEATMPLKHTVERYCEVLRRLGFVFNDPTPVTECERENPMPYDKGDQRWIGVAPFSAHKGKSYPLSHVHSVVEELSKRYDRIFIHSGGGVELEFAKEQASIYPNVEVVFGTMSLAQEIDLIANLDCIVTMDSFAMHVASLVATPAVSVWGATHPMLGFTGYGYDPDGVVQIEMKCRPCSTFGSKVCRFGDYRCLNDIEPMSVVEKVEVLISKSNN